MQQFVFEVTTIKNCNTRTAIRSIEAPTEHEARRALIQYYLTKRKARVVSLALSIQA